MGQHRAGLPGMQRGQAWTRLAGLHHRAGGTRRQRASYANAAFLKAYEYKPSMELREVAGELYDEMGEIAMTLIRAKIERVRDKL